MKRCGIVGLPNVGKSSLFNFLTQSNKAKSENYPFCTIEPNESVVFFEDYRVTDLKNFSSSKKEVFSPIMITDIAGLVEGASSGEGLGNKFLSHIREVDVIMHVVRCFDDKDVSHVTESGHPVQDLEVIFTELRIADKETIENMRKKTKDKQVLEDLNYAEKCIDEEISFSSTLPLLCAKPFFVLGNGEDLQLIEDLKKYTTSRNIKFINFDVKKVSDPAFAKYSKENIANLCSEIFQLLKIIFFFTTGKEESRAWAIKEGINAKEAAAEIHTDISNRFIKATVFNINEIKTKYRVRNEGKDYIVKDGDIIVFQHNA